MDSRICFLTSKIKPKLIVATKPQLPLRDLPSIPYPSACHLLPGAQPVPPKPHSSHTCACMPKYMHTQTLALKHIYKPKCTLTCLHKHTYKYKDTCTHMCAPTSPHPFSSLASIPSSPVISSAPQPVPYFFLLSSKSKTDL